MSANAARWGDWCGWPGGSGNGLFKPLTAHVWPAGSRRSLRERYLGKVVLDGGLALEQGPCG